MSQLLSIKHRSPFESVWAQKLSLSLALSFIIAIAAQIEIPLSPVPITLQSFAVLMIAARFGSEMGALSVACYLLEGALGLPVFAQGSHGLATLLGPSGGYLLGFLPASFLSGYLLERSTKSSYLTTFVSALLGMFVIFAIGVPILAQFLGWTKALQLGLYPFLVTDLFKVLSISALLPSLKRSSAA